MGDHLMSLIKANDIQNASGGIPTVKSQQLIPTAWVNFNGTGTVAIRDSENISSLVDVSTGKYTINFATNMANVNYATIASYGGHEPSGGQGVRTPFATNDPQVGSTNMNVGNQNSDSPVMSVIIMGGQS